MVEVSMQWKADQSAQVQVMKMLKLSFRDEQDRGKICAQKSPRQNTSMQYEKIRLKIISFM